MGTFEHDTSRERECAAHHPPFGEHHVFRVRERTAHHPPKEAHMMAARREAAIAAKAVFGSAPVWPTSGAATGTTTTTRAATPGVAIVGAAVIVASLLQSEAAIALLVWSLMSSADPTIMA